MSAPRPRPCCIPICEGEKFDLVHKFPRDNERAKEWLRIINLPALENMSLDTIRQRYFICSRHFRPADYKNALSRSLNITANPSQNLRVLDAVSVNKSHLRSPTLVPVKRDVAFVSVLDQSLDLVEEAEEEQQESESHFVISFGEDPLPPPPLIKANPIARPSTMKRRQSPSPAAQVVVQRKKPRTNDTVAMELDLHNEEEDLTVSLSPFWLRDHCRCELCYNRETCQRRFSVLDIPADVCPVSWTLKEEELSVEWSDGHKSTYEAEFLRKSNYIVAQRRKSTRREQLWTVAEISSEEAGYARVDFSQLICDDAVIKRVLSSLIRFGVAFIEKVPATTPATEMAVKRMFEIQKTLFGEMWTFSDNREHNDTAYSREALSAHTDNTYFNDPAGLQVLHCIQHLAGEGGDSIAVDGFKVLDRLKAEHPDVFQRLCTTMVPAEYIENGRHHKHVAPIVRCDPLSGHVEQIRFNLDDRATMDTLETQEEIERFYADLRLLATSVRDEKVEWRFKLTPGTIFIFDNWRILHGRTAYTGKRVMTGCYVSRTEFLSACRVAGVID